MISQMNPKVTVITASYNDPDHLAKTIESVLSQNYQNIEHVIVDGSSNDASLNIIKQYAGKNPGKIRWLHEPDKGISDAFNKGLLLSEGEYIHFLGVGDFFWDKDVVEKIFSNLSPESKSIICGSVARVSSDNHVRWITKAKPVSKYRLLKCMPLPHQGMFMHKDFFKAYGNFRLDVKYSMDYELLLRAYKNFPTVMIKNFLVAAWLEGGVGKGHIEAVLYEYHMNRKQNRVCNGILLEFIYRWSCIKHYIKKIIRFRY